MSSTYLELTNRVLRRIGEVTMAETDFSDVRGVQALAKDAVKDSVDRINAQKWEWPFNAYEHQMTLGVGLEEYAWPDTLKVVDWNSFQIQKDESLGVNSTHSVFKNKDEWYSQYKDTDDDAGENGIGVPQFVSEAHGGGFAIFPSPDKAYKLRFKYWINPPELINASDTTTIPRQFEYVIINGALYILNMYRENDSTLAPLEDMGKQGISEMANILLTNYDHMTDTRIPRNL